MQEKKIWFWYSNMSRFKKWKVKPLIYKPVTEQEINFYSSQMTMDLLSVFMSSFHCARFSSDYYKFSDIALPIVWLSLVNIAGSANIHALEKPRTVKNMGVHGYILYSWYNGRKYVNNVICSETDAYAWDRASLYITLQVSSLLMEAPVSS